jgi:tetratricopeptide (TPR) repeat protein
MRQFPGYAALAVLAFSVSTAQGQVSVREEPMVIPTWEIGPPALHSLSPNPKGPIYPYTLNETLTDRKTDKTYRAVILENEYVKILVLPEIGGRLHGAADKTNGYIWLYWQETIKPGLISMTGAWISGGIEWNFPHGHRPSGFMPVDYRLVRNADGSATVWVGETEPVYRMRWLVGMTLFPGRSYLRCDYIFVNPTNYRQPFQFWSTAATHANEWAQAQYPGDMVTGHGKEEFWNWPVHEGVDLTWWKNSPNASSYFAFNNPSDWFGTYDHKAQGGMVHVANHHVMPGKKLWTWGSGPSGRIWEDILTEGGGPYFEPQAGAWSDNQPDYHWMAPHQVRTASDYWYPVRDTRGYHNADADFALNTDLADGKAFAAVYATGVFDGCRVVLKDTKQGRILSEASVSISPDRPYSVEVSADAGTTLYDLHLAVYGPGGGLRMELQRMPPRKVELPAGQKDPGDPKDLNQDELFHAGEWLDKFVRTEEALSYYQEALKRDPGDSRVNVEMGFLALKQGRWQEALKHLDAALARDYDNSRIYFGRGLVYLGLRDWARAEAEFYRASYTADFHSAACLNLARLEMLRGNYHRAIEKANEAQAGNGKLADIPALKAAAWRRSGEPAKAKAEAQRALELDPMHFMAWHETVLASRPEPDSKEAEAGWSSIMRGSVQNYLELACSYAEAGLFREADELLAGVAAGKPDTDVYPMINYLRGHFKQLEGDDDAASGFYARAAKGPVSYTNPHRLEEKTALEAALSARPNDAAAHLFLGNLLYFALGQRPEGQAHWRRAVESNPALSLAWRNLGYAESRQEKPDLKMSLDAYERVLEIDPSDARALLELDQVAERLQATPAARLARFQRLPATVTSRDDLVARLVDLHLQEGSPRDLEAAYDQLRNRHFHTWEGSYGIHHSWVEVNQQLGDLALAENNPQLARTYYQQACEYPGNLEVAPRTPDFRAHVNWNLARVYQALKQPDRAREYLTAIVGEKYRQAHLGSYYQALAHKTLGDLERHAALLATLEERARLYTSGEFEYRGRRNTIGHYLLSLVLEERGDQAGAALELKKALAADPQARRLAITEAQLDRAGAHQ